MQRLHDGSANSCSRDRSGNLPGPQRDLRHPELDPADPKRHTALNPKLLVEVLSPSTEDYDLGEKFENYKQIESLEEVMFVHHDERKIVTWRRTGRSWTATEYSDGVIPLAIECELSVAAVYRDPMA